MCLCLSQTGDDSSIDSSLFDGRCSVELLEFKDYFYNRSRCMDCFGGINNDGNESLFSSEFILAWFGCLIFYFSAEWRFSRLLAAELYGTRLSWLEYVVAGSIS